MTYVYVLQSVYRLYEGTHLPYIVPASILHSAFFGSVHRLRGQSSSVQHPGR